MDISEFTVIANITRSREPIRTAVMLVLVDGHSDMEAAEITGVLTQTIRKTVTRFKYIDAEIRRAYLVPKTLFSTMQRGA